METPGISNHVTVCPGRDELAAFSAGLLPSTLLESVADHLSACPRCQSTLGDLEGRGDTILSDLRRPLLQDPFLDEPECGQLEAHAKAIALDLSRATTPLPDEPTRPAGDLANDLPVPARLGQYELLQRLGKGGMGVVYKARQRNLDRVVALKRILSGAYASPQELARFHIEATDLARLRHPNIVQIYETGEDENCPYFSMEFVDGGNLARQLDGAPLPARRAAELVETLSRAMHHAHQQGIVHRDLKPGNVLMTADGVPKVTDFGLAKGLGREGEQTEPGAILGTPSYMAPEQACGKNHEIGPVTDVYGLGAILYELVTGRPPFRGTNAADTLHQVRSQEPVSPSRLQPKVPRDLETICLKCLQKEPQKRYASALALAEELRCFLHGEPIRARPVGHGERLWRWCRRNPALAAASGLAAAFLVMAATVSTTFAVYQAEAARRLTVALGQSEKNRQELIEISRKSARVALVQGLYLCEQGDPARGTLWLAHSLEMATEANDADLQRVIRLNLAAARRQLSPLRACLAHTGAVLAVALSPDGKTVVTGSKDGKAQLWDAVSGKLVGDPLPHQDPVNAVAFSPDGKILVTASGEPSKGKRGAVQFWETGTRKPLGPSLPHEGPVHAVAFSPDGRTILTGSFNSSSSKGEVRLWDVATGSQRVVHQHRGEPVVAVVFSPDGRTILTGITITGISKTAQVWNFATNQPIGEPLEHDKQVLAVAFSPDGKIVLTGSRDRTARLWEASTGRPIGQPLSHPDAVCAVAFSPDGQNVITGCNDNVARLWQTSTGKPTSAPLHHRGRVLAVAFGAGGKAVVTGGDDKIARLWDVVSWKPMHRSLQHTGSVRAVAFSPDGRTALTGSRDNTARLWETATGRLLGRPLAHQDAVFGLAFSPDGKIVLTGSWDTTACLWDATTGEKLHQLKGHKGLIHSVAFSPDGKTVLTASADHTAQLWDVATGQPVGRPLPHQNSVTAVAFSPDGRSVLTGSGDKAARLWETATGNLIHEFLGHNSIVKFVTFSADGKKVLTGSFDHTAQVWETTSGLPVGPALIHQDTVWAGTFSPDGKVVVTASWDATARLWDAVTGKPMPVLQHKGEVLAVSFSPDGKALLTGSSDGTARVWDVATGEPIGPSFRHQGEVWAVAFSPDGKTILTGSDDRTACLWEAQAPASVEVPAERILLWAQLITGMELDPNGLTNVMDAPSWQRCRQRLVEMGNPQLP